ncbi:MAG: SDR family oxidoreductase [Verrucomicrobiae bacterium]|nr:SDR family oxidoreductase [Verrucomicrobiae bacterium]
MELNFRDKIALITGGSSGIGRETAVSFAREGAKVVVAARRVKEGTETVELVRAAGGEASFVQTDVSQSADVIAMVDHCISTYGRLDFAFNNAGVEGTVFTPTVHYDEQVWDQVININLKGVWLCMKYQIPKMLASGGGAIVNMSSVAGLYGSTIGVAYTASKHGVIGATKTAANECATKGIRINAICPAVIQTPMADRGFYENKDITAQDVAGWHRMNRVGTPAEVASAVLWLCSDGAGFVTGHALPIDGGMLM